LIDHCLLVAWDVDDVLNSLTSDWARDLGEAGLIANPSASDATEYFVARGWTVEDFLAGLDEFRATKFHTMAPNPLALEAMRVLNSLGCMQVAVTKTPLKYGPIVSHWVLTNFGQWLSGVFVVPSPRSTDPLGFSYREKRDVASIVNGPVILIDDSPLNLSELPSNCAGVLYPQPWNDAMALELPEELLKRVREARGDISEDGVTRR
jgi:hypothetical protein